MIPQLMLGTVHQILGLAEKMVEEGKKTIAFDPESFAGYSNVAAGALMLDQLGEAEDAMRRASDHKAEDPTLLFVRHDIAFLKADDPARARLVALSIGKPGDEDLIADKEAFVLAYYGRLQQARGMSRHAVDLAQQAAQPESSAIYEAGAALREAMFGNVAEARGRAKAALTLSKNREVVYGAGLALALSGDSGRSQGLMDDIEKRFGEDTSVRYAYAPELRAVLAINGGEPLKALEALRVAINYELGEPRSTIHGFYGALYPAYVRGLAYLAAHEGMNAAGEFQKIIEHRGVVVSDPIGALAHLQLGRAFEIAGDHDKARSAYQDFVTLWKDADPDIPIYKQAKAEFAKLQ
jgi:tetratricopeptide (TPR) repeat protein